MDECVILQPHPQGDIVQGRGIWVPNAGVSSLQVAEV
jgi:hypothetical protein